MNIKWKQPKILHIKGKNKLYKYYVEYILFDLIIIYLFFEKLIAIMIDKNY